MAPGVKAPSKVGIHHLQNDLFAVLGLVIFAFDDASEATEVPLQYNLVSLTQNRTDVVQGYLVSDLCPVLLGVVVRLQSSESNHGVIVCILVFQVAQTLDQSTSEGSPVPDGIPDSSLHPGLVVVVHGQVIESVSVSQFYSMPPLLQALSVHYCSMYASELFACYSQTFSFGDLLQPADPQSFEPSFVEEVLHVAHVLIFDVRHFVSEV